VAPRHSSMLRSAPSCVPLRRRAPCALSSGSTVKGSKRSEKGIEELRPKRAVSARAGGCLLLPSSARGMPESAHAPQPRRPAALQRAARRCPPPPPRTKWTRRVPHPVLIGHASSLPPESGPGVTLPRDASGPAVAAAAARVRAGARAPARRAPPAPATRAASRAAASLRAVYAATTRWSHCPPVLAQPAGSD
jgi:hypothetical protein